MPVGGYTGEVLRVDLSAEKMTAEPIDENTLRKYLGGTGLGIKFLYEEVSPDVTWCQPENRLLFFSGPLGGSSIGGSGSFSVVTKGALTNGATSSQANGFFGAFLKFSGFDGIILQGKARVLSYLYIHDGVAELRDATHLKGQDTWEIEEILKKELGKRERELSVYSIGPAGENLVKFACIVGDRGHVVAHNGVGAVMGSKNLKAIVAARGKGQVEVADKTTLSTLAKEMFQTSSNHIYIHTWGTLGDKNQGKRRLLTGTLPVKNYTTNLFPKGEQLTSEHIRPMFRIKPNPCWACRSRHLHMMEITQGAHAGLIIEEPEYEQWAAWGPLIGQEDVIEAAVLSNHVDRLGMDTNESAWLIAWLMECCGKGLVTAGDLDGIELGWGNVSAVRAILNKIASRDGIGNILAEGIKNAAQRFGGEAGSLAVYTHKGNTPRMHDHRSVWTMILDTCLSDTGTDEHSVMARPINAGLPADADPFTPDVAATILSRKGGRMPFDDCLGICMFNSMGTSYDFMARVLSAATGWDFTEEEAMTVSLRVVNLLRAFNIRHGLTADLDLPSPKYGSTPTDGPCEGIGILPVWQEMVRNYYRQMGWESKTGKPLPETLRSLGLEQL